MNEKNVTLTQGDNISAEQPQNEEVHSQVAVNTQPGKATPNDISRIVAGASGRSRSRWVRFGSRHAVVSPALEPVVRTLREHFPKADIGVVERAYAIAEKAHRGQFRKSGEPYITHPMAVAGILAGMGAPETAIAAGLLHDTVEDTEYSLNELRRDFGDEIALIVDGVTKLDKVQYGEAAAAETVRKMVLAMAKDVRVIFVKLADRLHNARTWKYVPSASASKKARETLEIYAPLAHRLGINAIKWELEDLSFKVLYPDIYSSIEELVAERAPARKETLDKVIAEIQVVLKENKIEAEVYGRPKHYYSIYQKMVVRGHDFHDIYDLIGIRVLVNTVSECYAAMGVIHQAWPPLTGRIKDYIAMPKFSTYRSVHTTVMGSNARPMEIQIRTHEMHREAEYGIAAHWRYKDQGRSKTSAKIVTGAKSATIGQTELDWLRRLADWQNETTDPEDFLDALRYEITGNEVYVFTPQGNIIKLPEGATPVDFAYSVHTEVGHRMIGAEINGHAVPFKTKLSSGDVITILTSNDETHGPNRDWLSFVKSTRAQNKIKQWFTKERREESVDRGKKAIAIEMRKQNLPLQRLLSHQNLTLVADDLNFHDITSMYAAVGEGNASAQTVIRHLVNTVGGKDANAEDLAEVVRPENIDRPRRTGADAPEIVVEGVTGVWVKLAKCCSPVPGDAITGFTSRLGAVSVHRNDCNDLLTLREQEDEGRFAKVRWETDNSAGYSVRIRIKAIDRIGLIRDVSAALAEHRANISDMRIQRNNPLAISDYEIVVADLHRLNAVLASIQSISGVASAERVAQNDELDSKTN